MNSFGLLSQHLQLIQLFAVVLAGLVALVFKAFRVPTDLRHLPRVSIVHLLLSYLTVEEENQRIERLFMPYVARGDGIVVVWALGRWVVHILDEKIARQLLEDMDLFPKEQPPDDLLLWKFIGTSNVLLQNGDGWRKHSQMVRNALQQTLPIDQFVHLSKKLLRKIGSGGTHQFDDYAQRFALDAVGTTVLGHDFDSIDHDSPFVQDYNAVMYGIADPVYLIMPFMERVRPRHKLLSRMNNLVAEFQKLLQAKKDDPGDDVMTYMLKEPNMTNDEFRDNMVLLFIAGHDTSAGGLSSLIYYLAKHPEIQEVVRQEVLSVLAKETEPAIDHLQRMPFLTACIREALRINTPISYIVPRAPSQATRLGPYSIPAKTTLICNLYAIHHDPRHWNSPHIFDPNRFLDLKGGTEDTWLPFAVGPRQCPARNFAMYEQRVLVVMLLRQYRWKLPEGSPHTKRIKNAFSPFALSVPHNLDIDFKKL